MKAKLLGNWCKLTHTHRPRCKTGHLELGALPVTICWSKVTQILIFRITIRSRWKQREARYCDQVLSTC